jgi:transcription elongation factor Elf1
MPAPRRLECPYCETAYRPERCGLTLKPGLRASVVCMVCRKSFDIRCQPGVMYGFTVETYARDYLP